MPAKIRIVILSHPSKTDQEGKNPICLQFTQNRKVRRIRLGKTVFLKQWKGSPPEYVKVKGPDQHPNARMLNLFLNKEITRAEKIILDTEIAGKTVSFDDFKSSFLNLQESDFFAWHDKFVQYRQVVGEMKDSTLVRYESQRNKLKQFKQEILMTDITSDFVHKYNDFLAETLNNSHNTRQKSLSYLKSIFEYAKTKGAAQRQSLRPGQHGAQIRAPYFSDQR